jgi:hypothetical protein
MGNGSRLPNIWWRCRGQSSAQVKEWFGQSDLPWLLELLADLQRDGLVTLEDQKTRAALP